MCHKTEVSAPNQPAVLMYTAELGQHLECHRLCGAVMAPQTALYYHAIRPWFPDIFRWDILPEIAAWREINPIFEFRIVLQKNCITTFYNIKMIISIEMKLQ